jgi:glycosyltransferase involved in cell wall biosynthesis
MPPHPSFTVVTAAYQAAETIGDAVASVLGQTYPAAEMIISDDGSTDGLVDALQPFRHDVKLLRNRHRGPGAARNAALEAASGEFVVILDADDLYEPRRLEALAELIRGQPQLDIATTDALLERDGEIIGRFYRDDFVFPVTDQRNAILRRCFLFAPAVRRTRMEQIGGFDESQQIAPAEDWDCWMRLILDGAEAGLVPEALIRYRLHPGSLTSNRARSLRARVTVMEKAAARDDLTAEERDRLHQALAIRRRDAVLAEASAALDQGAADARRRCLSVVTARKVPARQRAKAAVGFVSPRLARRSPPRS